MFCKVFGPEHDQVLVKCDVTDDGPEIRVFFEPPNLGLCSFAIQFMHEDEDTAFKQRDAAFQEITEEKARDGVSRVMRSLGLSQDTK